MHVAANARHRASGDRAAVTAAEIERRVGRLREAQRQLAGRSPHSIMAALDDVVCAWLMPDSPWRARAEALLPEATGFAPAMIREALPAMLEPLRAPALAELVAAEAASRRGPALILHVLPGNLPGLAAVPIALSLAVGSAVLLKAGAGDRVFPELFAASIAERDAQLGSCVAACYWPGGDRACETIALGAADLTVVSGGDEAVADLSRRARGRVIGHGHRVSFAVVAREIGGDAAAADAAARLAHDVAVWDQRGCLSPQLCFVEGNLEQAIRFGELVAAALEPLAERWPPRRMTTAERLDVRRLRDSAEWRALGGGGGALFAAVAEGAGTVVVDPCAAFSPSPLCRSIRVMPVADVRDLPAVLAPVRGVLESAGLAAAPARWAAIAADLGAAGVHRICALGDMQRPPLAWCQGGRPRLADWVSP